MKNLCDIVIFGGHGDLAFRKLLPAFYVLYSEGYLHDDSCIILVSRECMDASEHIALVRKKLITFLPEHRFSQEQFDLFSRCLKLITIDFTDPSGFASLQTALDTNPDRDRIYYLSTAPDFFGLICKTLYEYGLVSRQSRVVLEKPIGYDLLSSKAINEEVLCYFDEHQIYRIDHYLGKDTVQNILALRFSNRIFMPLWNANHIDHVQITVAESVGVEGRWGYYNEYGALRDMIQNHLMQLLCLIAMEPPASLDADSVRDEKVKY